MLIDIHTHVFKKPLHFPCIPPFCSPKELIAECDAMGIDKAVLLPVVGSEIYMPQTNEDILEITAEYPDRFIPFCNVDPRALSNSPNAPLDVVLQYYKDNGCKGIGEVMPNMQVMDPKVQNLFACAEKVGLPITYDGSDQLDGDFGLYDDPGLPQLEHTLQRFPKLKIFGHGPIFWAEIARLETIGERGYVFSFDGLTQVGNANRGKIKEEGVMPKLLRKYPNLLCDLSDGTCYNALTRDEEYTFKFIEEFGDRMFFGTDMCFPGMKVPLIAKLKEWKDKGKISESNYEKITHENAEKLLEI